MGVNQSKSENVALAVISVSCVVCFGLMLTQQPLQEEVKAQELLPSEQIDQKVNVEIIAESTQNQNARVEQQETFEKKSSLAQKQIELIQNINLSWSNNYLDIHTIFQIQEISTEIVAEEFIEYTKKNRIERRLIRKIDLESYEQLLWEYNEQVEQMLDAAQLAILGSLKIRREIFEESVIHYFNQGFVEQFLLFQASVRQKLKQKLKPQRKICLQDYFQIFDFQKEILRSKPQFLLQILIKLKRNPEQQQLIPFTVNTILSDLVFEQFGFEEEDQLQSFAEQSFQDDHRIQDSLREIQDCLNEIFTEVDHADLEAFVHN